MRDPRIDKLADVLVNYSVHCQKGEKVLIEARGIDLLYAGVEVLLGYYNGFSWGIGVNAGYEHFPASNFFYRLGYRYNTIVGHQGMLSMGVLF